MEPHILKVKIKNLNVDRAAEFRKAAQAIPGVNQVDVNVEKGLGRIISQAPIAFAALRDRLREFEIEEYGLAQSSSVMKIRVDGMTCRSCEVAIERQFKKVPGVRKVDVDATRGLARIIVEDSRVPSLAELEGAIKDSKYKVRGFAPSKNEEPAGVEHKRPTALQLIGLFALVLLLGAIFSKTGLLKSQTVLGTSVSFSAAFFIGLVAASSSCIAVSGGLLLGISAKFRERYAALSPIRRMQPVFLFVAGRLAGYGILGGVIGAIGSALSPSPFVTGMITLVAALFMLVMGLDMLHLAPAWLKRLLPRMPKALAHRVMAGEDKNHPAAPLLLGAGTFFLPCGFTQALQLYALTTGSALTSGAVLFAFALGTAPALLVLGWASGSLKGAFGRFFFRFSGALVIVLGLWNLQNGLTIAGYPLTLPRFEVRTTTAQAGDVADQGAEDPNVRFDGQTQIIAMQVSGIPPYYKPSDSYTVRAGLPVRMEISGVGTGCRSVFQIPKLGVREFLGDSPTVVEFTPKSPGSYVFSCSMGMFRGQLTVR